MALLAGTARTQSEGLDRPPTATIASPAMAAIFEAPQTIALVAGLDPDGAPLTFEWRVDRQTEGRPDAEALRATGPRAELVLDPEADAAPGCYRIELAVTDGAGRRATSHVWIYPRRWARDISAEAVPIARVFELAPPRPLGGGSQDIEVVRDGWFPAPGSLDDHRQFDSFHFGDQGGDDWIGYALPAPPEPGFRFTGIDFQEGKHFVDGGWFADLRVEVRRDGAWSVVPLVSTTPAYPLEAARKPYCDGRNFDTFHLRFDPVPGDAIRLRGTPGGSYGFISVGELRVQAVGPMQSLHGAAGSVVPGATLGPGTGLRAQRAGTVASAPRER